MNDDIAILPKDKIRLDENGNARLRLGGLRITWIF
jgi:hypothetical protein